MTAPSPPPPLSEGLDLPLKSHARKPLLAGNALPTLSVDKFVLGAQRKITRHEFPLMSVLERSLYALAIILSISTTLSHKYMLS